MKISLTLYLYSRKLHFVVQATFPDQYFRVISSSPNGVVHEVETLHHGIDYILATLDEIIPLGSEDPLAIQPPITGEQVSLNCVNWLVVRTSGASFNRL